MFLFLNQQKSVETLVKKKKTGPAIYENIFLREKQTLMVQKAKR